MIVDAAEFVCSVDTTKCPVIAACTAIPAVSPSRISPIMMISGSCRRIDLRAAANVISALLLTCTWLIPLILASTGSSTVMILTSSVLSSLSEVYSVVDFPDPVGPVTRIIPCGLLRILSNTFSCSASKPRALLGFVRPSLDVSLITVFSPNTVGRMETRTSNSLLSTMIVIRPSCGFLFSAMSIPPMILIRAVIPANILRSYDITCFSAPSILYLTLTLFSRASICISDALCLTPPSIICFTRRTIGELSTSSLLLSSSSPPRALCCSCL